MGRDRIVVVDHHGADRWLAVLVQDQLADIDDIDRPCAFRCEVRPLQACRILRKSIAGLGEDTGAKPSVITRQCLQGHCCPNAGAAAVSAF